jgi:hypothetical protein
MKILSTALVAFFIIILRTLWRSTLTSFGKFSMYSSTDLKLVFMIYIFCIYSSSTMIADLYISECINCKNYALKKIFVFIANHLGHFCKANLTKKNCFANGIMHQPFVVQRGKISDQPHLLHLHHYCHRFHTNATNFHH